MKGYIRIIAKSKEEALALASYIWRATDGAAGFYRPSKGRDGEWLIYGEIEIPEEEERTKEHNQ